MGGVEFHARGSRRMNAVEKMRKLKLPGNPYYDNMLDFFATEITCCPWQAGLRNKGRHCKADEVKCRKCWVKALTKDYTETDDA